MQNVVIAEPYRFVPPFTGLFWPRIFGFFLPGYLRKNHGVVRVETKGAERLKASQQAGHGIMLAPNHCRPCDPFVLGMLSLETGQPFHIMASWHLFKQSRFQSWMLPRMGVFSLYREGLDREALKCAMGILATSRRPLVLFPEGVVSRHNDRLNHLMEGTAMMLRGAAKQRASASPPGKVVVHPVAIRYVFEGDVPAAVGTVLTDIETRLAWQPQDSLAPVDRILKVGSALLSLKEIEFFGAPQQGELAARVRGLVDRMLAPLEDEWLKGRHDPDVVSRVKLLRTAILPDLVGGELPEAEMQRRWRQLEVIYLAQQIAFYPAGYFTPAPTPERMLEVVEKFEEDLTDTCRIHTPFTARVEVGEAIEVSPERTRGGDGDPLMNGIRASLETMLGIART